MAQKCDLAANFPGAIDCYQQILALQPQRADIYAKLGNAFYQQKKLNQAVFAFQQAIALQPKQEPSVYRDLGALLVEQKQHERAIAIYQKAIKLYPNCASEFYHKLGDIYQRQNKYFLAKNFWRKAKQERALLNIKQVIQCIQQYFPSTGKLLAIDILDSGCEPTGKQLALLAEQTTGRVVGTNIYPGFPQKTIQRRRGNNEFYFMDGCKLDFDSATFDLVVSIDVLEHVRQPDVYLQECYRVLRPGGIGFFSWYPIWSGATGHHIHPDMVAQAAQKLNLSCPNYSLNNDSLPWWGHLIFSAQEMLSFLIEHKKYDPQLAKWMRDYTYHGQDLNRWHWQDIRQSFEHIAWEIVAEHHHVKQLTSDNIKQQLTQKYGDPKDFEICGAKIIIRK
ncbi:MAG: tetratricopeptide repeat protein [Cyanobacteria bacterium P01_G01_bin.19]